VIFKDVIMVVMIIFTVMTAMVMMMVIMTVPIVLTLVGIVIDKRPAQWKEANPN